ncbi:MAG: hypothetical protein U0U70_07965 [Chitinophagaceae bacterium]
MRQALVILLGAVLTGAGCNQDNRNPVPEKQKNVAATSSSITVKLLPLGNTTEPFITSVYDSLKKIISAVELLPPEAMPAIAFYKPRNRYRADTLIHWMSNRAKDNEVYVGITMQDISTTKGANPDYGVMGLGFQPGKACVASQMRLRNKSNFYKVVIHELGHTAGLPHCPVKTCFMRDAEGGDPTGEEKEFCRQCRAFLIAKGWRL